MPNKVSLEASWLSALEAEFSKPYFLSLRQFLIEEKQQGKTIYPPGNEIFAALDACPIPTTKVIIIGQDPYHGVNQANGLCFSVRKGVAIPPSLKNIYRELVDDIGIAQPTQGDLSNWASQGVLLLNATLTVESGKAGSHQNKGWEQFTDRIIEILNLEKEGLVFMLWGGYAKRKGKKINRGKHLVLESGHPSPLSANKGHWFGNKHFSKCNDYLISHAKQPINWDV